jgi:serine-type D-Ala-D-Ala carboxypeptidase/endopeptidase
MARAVASRALRATFTSAVLISCHGHLDDPSSVPGDSGRADVVDSSPSNRASPLGADLDGGASASSSTLVERIVDEVLAGAMADRDVFVGTAVGVVYGGESYVIYRGVAERGCDPLLGACPERASRARPITGDTLFGIGSVTKTFTATMLALMAERGLVRVDTDCDVGNCDDPVRNTRLRPLVPEPYRSQLHPVVGDVTLAMLADHNSGLPRNEAVLPDTPGDVFAQLTRCTPSGPNVCAEPGTYEYSNFAFAVLGYVLAREAGYATWSRAATDLVARPLGLEDTRVWEDLGGRRARVARGYEFLGGRTEPAERSIMLPGHDPSGGLFTSPADMMRWLRFSMSDPAARCSASADICELHRALATVKFPRAFDDIGALGLAWHVYELGSMCSPRVYWKGGSTPGYRTYVGFVPSEQVGVFVMSNYGETRDSLQRNIGVGTLLKLMDLQNGGVARVECDRREWVPDELRASSLLGK